MADPRRFKIQRPTPAGRARAQQPEAGARKTSLLAADLQKRKVEGVGGGTRITAADSPYPIRPEDKHILAFAGSGAIKVILPKSSENLGRQITVQKIDAIGAFSVEVFAEDRIGLGGTGTTASKYLHGIHASITIVATSAVDIFGGWSAIATLPTVDLVP